MQWLYVIGIADQVKDNFDELKAANAGVPGTVKELVHVVSRSLSEGCGICMPIVAITNLSHSHSPADVSGA